MFYIYRTLLGLILNTWLLNHTDADIKTDISLGRVNDLHTWQFPAGRPADLHKIKSPFMPLLGKVRGLRFGMLTLLTNI